MLASAGQLNSFWKSSEFPRGPITLNSPGEWTSERTWDVTCDIIITRDGHVTHLRQQGLRGLYLTPDLGVRHKQQLLRAELLEAGQPRLNPLGLH